MREGESFSFSMHGLAAGLSHHGWMVSGFGSLGLAEDDMF